MIRKVRNWLGFLVSIAAIAWLGWSYDFNEMLPHLKTTRYIYLAPIPLLLTCNFLLRSLRWRLLYAGKPPASLGIFFSALMIGNLFNNLLPARGGEFIKIYVLGNLAALSKSRILATVIVEKAADLLIAIGLLVALLAVYPAPDWARKAGAAVAVVVLAVVCFVVILGARGNRISSALLRCLRFLSAGIKARLEAAMQQFIAGLSGLLSMNRTTPFVLCSAVIWLLELVVMYVVARAFAIDVGGTDLLFVMLMILFGTLVPSSPGYIGTFEFFGLNALAVIGVTGGGALGFVVVLHAILLLGSSLLGVGCLAWHGWPRVTVAAETEPSKESG